MRPTILLTLLLIACTTTIASAQQENTSVVLVVSRHCANDLFTSKACATQLRTAISFAVQTEQPRAVVKVLTNLYDTLDELYQSNSINQELANKFFQGMAEINRIDKALHPSPEEAAKQKIADQCGEGNRDFETRETRYRRSIREQLKAMRELLPKISGEDARALVAEQLKALEELYVD